MRCSAIYSLLTLAWIGLLLTPARVLADDKAAARRHFENGKALYTEENYEGAAAEFEASVAAYPTKSGYFNLANCRKALHRYALALDTLGELRARFAAELRTDKELLAKVEELERSIRKSVGLLSVTSSPPGARISVDGEPVGTAPLPRAVLLGPGEHTVAAELDGYVAAEERVSVLSQSQSKVAFQLQPEEARLVVTVSAPGAEVRLDGEPVGRSPLPEALVVTPGQHAVDVKLAGYLPDHRELTLAAGEELLVDVNLVPKPSHRVEEPAISRRTLNNLAWIGVGSALALGGASAGLFHFRGEAITEFYDEDELYLEAGAADVSNHKKLRDEAGSRAEMLHGFGIATAVAAGACAVGALTAAILAAGQKKRETDSAVEVQAGLFSVELKF